ncbi:hypothetical protein DL93DRAFT_544772 [Clavulina sp. PMI_390]|nr:hypothetical protein DL93DRAFT_544772 [Clavulina sp. PMI_390]
MKQAGERARLRLCELATMERKIGGSRKPLWIEQLSRRAGVLGCDNVTSYAWFRREYDIIASSGRFGGVFCAAYTSDRDKLTKAITPRDISCGFYMDPPCSQSSAQGCRQSRSKHTSPSLSPLSHSPLDACSANLKAYQIIRHRSTTLSSSYHHLALDLLHNQAHSTTIPECSVTDDSPAFAQVQAHSLLSLDLAHHLLPNFALPPVVSTLCAHYRVRGIGIATRSTFCSPTSNCTICWAFMRAQGWCDQGRIVCCGSAVSVSMDTAPGLFNHSRLQQASQLSRLPFVSSLNSDTQFHGTVEAVLAHHQPFKFQPPLLV